MILSESDSSYALQRFYEHMTLMQEQEWEFHRARIRSIGMMPCKGILLDEVTDDWSGCDTKGGTLNDCPSCHGSGFVPIPKEADGD